MTTKKYSKVQLTVLVLVRIAIGWHFLYEGFVKLFIANWSAVSYLDNSRWIFSGIFQWIASTPAVLNIADFLMVWGFFKKVVIADRLAEYVNTVYNNAGDYGGLHDLIATFFFTINK